MILITEIGTAREVYRLPDGSRADLLADGLYMDGMTDPACTTETCTLERVVSLEEVLAAIANYRWNRTQAMTYDGETDVPANPALSVITSIAVAEQFAPTNGATRTFKLKPGAFRQWTVAQIVGYGMAIGAYVQACFDREQALADQATGGDIAGALAALETGWPA